MFIKDGGSQPWLVTVSSLTTGSLEKRYMFVKDGSSQPWLVTVSTLTGEV